MNVDLVGWLVGSTSTQRATVGGLVVVVLAGVVLAARRLRRVRLSSVATLAVVAIVTGTTVDGAIRFARDGLGTHGVETLFPAVVFEALAVSTYSRARAYARIHGHPGPWAGRLYLLGAVAGTIIATAGDSLGAIGFRAIMPILAVRLLVWDLTPDGQDERAGSAVTWRWTPRRLGILIGAITPGDEDLDEVHRGHAIRRMATCRQRIDHGGWLPRRWYRARLRRLALRVDDEVIDQVRHRVTRAALVETLTAPELVDPPRFSVAVTCSDPPVDSIVDPVRELATTPAVTVENGRTSPQVDPDSEPVLNRPAPGRVRGSGNAEIVRQASEANPGATVAELAQLTRLSESTVKRYRPAQRVNGSLPQLLDAPN